MNELIVGKRPAPQNATSFYAIHNGWLIAIFSLVYIVSAWYLQSQVLTDDPAAEVLHKVGLYTYAFVPPGLLLRMAAVAFCLFTGLLLTGRTLSFAKTFKIVLLAEIAFVAYALLKLLILAFFHPIGHLKELQAFAPLSLYSLLDAAAVPRWLTYPLQTINVFEITYWFLLAAGLRNYLGQPLSKMFLLVLSSYGVGLLGWMIAVEFLTLNFTQ